MFTYDNNNVTETVTSTDFNKIGEITLKQTKTLPFFKTYFRGNQLPRNGTAYGLCKETDGDCFEFVKKYMNINIISNNQLTPFKSGETKIFEAHVCTPDEITKKHYDNGILYICLASDKTILQNNWDYYPHKDLSI